MNKHLPSANRLGLPLTGGMVIAIVVLASLACANAGPSSATTADDTRYSPDPYVMSETHLIGGLGAVLILHEQDNVQIDERKFCKGRDKLADVKLPDYLPDGMSQTQNQAISDSSAITLYTGGNKRVTLTQGICTTASAPEEHVEIVSLADGSDGFVVYGGNTERGWVRGLSLTLYAETDDGYIAASAFDHERSGIGLDELTKILGSLRSTPVEEYRKANAVSAEYLPTFLPEGYRYESTRRFNDKAFATVFTGICVMQLLEYDPQTGPDEMPHLVNYQTVEDDAVTLYYRTNIQFSTMMFYYFKWADTWFELHAYVGNPSCGLTESTLVEIVRSLEKQG